MLLQKDNNIMRVILFITLFFSLTTLSFGQKSLNFINQEITIEEAFDQLKKIGYSLSYRNYSYKYQKIKLPKRKLNLEDLLLAIKRQTALNYKVIGQAITFYKNKNYTISGYITDKNNGESIVGANIYSKALNIGVTSNTYGFYSLTLPQGIYDISFTFIGYQNQVKNFNLNSAVTHDVEFEISLINIKEIVE